MVQSTPRQRRLHDDLGYGFRPGSYFRRELFGWHPGQPKAGRGRTLEVLSEILMSAPIFRPLVAEGESLYLLTSEVLYALAMPDSGRDSPPQSISLVGD